MAAVGEVVNGDHPSSFRLHLFPRRVEFVVVDDDDVGTTIELFEDQDGVLFLSLGTPEHWETTARCLGRYGNLQRVVSSILDSVSDLCIDVASEGDLGASARQLVGERERAHHVTIPDPPSGIGADGRVAARSSSAALEHFEQQFSVSSHREYRCPGLSSLGSWIFERPVITGIRSAHALALPQ